MHSSWFKRAVFLFAISSLSIFTACSKKDVQPESAAVSVTTLELQAKSLPLVIEASGRTEGSKEVEVRARVSGILEKRQYNEGAPVSAGAILFRIEKAP